ncbi:MAG: MMPL family transporter [Solirubrobacterales bacterium]|nr:MMPL family transporter [Solirubrobacterales bacterium]
MLRSIADLATRRPRAILALTGLLFALAVIIGGPAAGLLDTSGNPFTDPDSETEQARERLESAAGEEAGVGLIALVDASEGIESSAVRDRVDSVAATLAADPAVARTLTTYETGDPALVSRDGESTYVAAVFADVADDDIDEAVEGFEAEFGAEPAVTLGGPALAGGAVGDQVGEDIGKAEALAFPLLFALSLIFFRGFVAALLPLFVGILTIFGTFLVLRLINAELPLSIFALNLVIALGLGLAIDYSLFIVSRYREELARSGAGAEALRRTLATAGRTVLFSTLTVAAALASLLLFPQQFLYSMGIGGVIVALIAAATSLVALPALLALLGPRVNSLAPKRLRGASERVARGESTGGWYRLSRAVMRRPALIAVLTSVLLLLLGSQFLRIAFTGFSAENLPETSAPRQVDDALDEDFPTNPSSSLIVAIEAGPSAEEDVTALGDEIAGLTGVAAVEPPRYLGADTWRADVVSDSEPLDDQSQELVDAIRSLQTPLPVGVTGETADFVDQQSSLASRLPLALAVLCLTTLVLLFLLTGSLILPIKALLMNVLTLSAAFGLLVLIFQDGRLEGVLGYESEGALESTQPVLLFALVFGLSTDYAVFLLSRIKEARDEGLDETEAVARGLERTGRIVTAAAVLFCVAIGAFATSQIVFIKELGVGTALAVIIDATLIRALLVPALMALLGKWNWWAPAPLRRLHRRVGLSEG